MSVDNEDKSEGVSSCFFAVMAIIIFFGLLLYLAIRSLLMIYIQACG